MSKQLMPVYDKPIIYYPLSLLMDMGIRDILIITTANYVPMFKYLLKDGRQLGISISYEIQSKPRGIADAFIIGEKFIGTDDVALVLGDNMFHGENLSNILRKAVKEHKHATVFGYYVEDARPYGVVDYDEKTNKAKAIIEKPENPPSHYAVPGLYLYDSKVIDISKSLEPSGRGELEITDVNKYYLELDELYVQLLGKDVTWFDTGTSKNLHFASEYVKETYEENKVLVGSIEHIAYTNGFIDTSQYMKLIEDLEPAEYAKVLREFI